MLYRNQFRADVTYSVYSLPRAAAHDAAIEAIRATRKELAGLENRDAPPGSMPL